ncbi:MAG: Spy/CpxP family protein refolding chaperone [Gemmatimonadales bacterium]
MRVVLSLMLATGLLSTPVTAQDRGQFEPPPDHWLTLDSLIDLVQITADQRDTVAAHYHEINALLKQAAEKRKEMMSSVSGGQRDPAMRQRFMEMRERMVGMQEEVDRHYAAIRSLLTEEQWARFDELAKPVVIRRRRM